MQMALLLAAMIEVPVVVYVVFVVDQPFDVSSACDDGFGDTFLLCASSVAQRVQLVDGSMTAVHQVTWELV